MPSIYNKSQVENTWRTIINKQFEKYNITMDDIDADQIKKDYGIEWYQLYTLTNEEYDEWKNWATIFIKHRFKCSFKKAQGYVHYIAFNHGLKVTDEKNPNFDDANNRIIVTSNEPAEE